MVAERNPDFSIYGKTGWAASAEPQVGWYVGYLETHDDVWFFALNMDIRSETGPAAPASSWCVEYLLKARIIRQDGT